MTDLNAQIAAALAALADAQRVDLPPTVTVTGDGVDLTLDIPQ